MKKYWNYWALCLMLSLGATNVYSQAKQSAGQQQKTTPSATKTAATQQKQQTPVTNSLIGKSLDSPEFKALKLEYITSQELRDEGSEDWSSSCVVWGYSKKTKAGMPVKETERYFLVNKDNSKIVDELIWEKKADIYVNTIEVENSATKETEEHFLRYKVVNYKCVILSYYECRDGKFVEKKPLATWSVGPDTLF
jgi:hypothetical protein